MKNLSINYFCNTKVARFGEIYLPQNTSAVHTVYIISIQYSEPCPYGSGLCVTDFSKEMIFSDELKDQQAKIILSVMVCYQ